MADLFKKIDDLAKAHNAKRVVCARIRLGALSHISAAHFREHFLEGSKGGVAEGARLEIEESQDAEDPNAQHILLREIEVA
jgi:hydrogenase nickel incorporation protein HypA/HybF